MSRRLAVKSMMSANPDMKPHLQQVRSYCTEFSVPIAVLTNGRTFFTFLASRTDGVPWQEGELIVFPDIFADTFNFTEFYQLLSRHAVQGGAAHNALLKAIKAPSPKNVLSHYADPHGVLPRNKIGLILEPILRSIFSEVTSEYGLEILEHCYVFPAESPLRDQEFETLLLDRPPSYADESFDLASRNVYERFHANIKDYLSTTDWSGTLLIIGGIGVGKTMFLQRFFRLPRPGDSIQRKTVALFIDFRTPGLNPEAIPELIYERLEKQIIDLDGTPVPDDKENRRYDFLSLEGLTQVFWSELSAFNRGPAKLLFESQKMKYEQEKVRLLDSLRQDRKVFVRACIRTLNSRYNRYVCIVLDNADQCDPKYQSSVYLYSRTLQVELKTLVVVALREEWYWHWAMRQDGPLSAFHDTIYHIPAPRSRDVLAKRLDYAMGLLEEHGIPRSQISLGQSMQLEPKHLKLYLNSCRNAFFDDEEISLAYECLANGEVREALQIFLDFIRSGHTRVEEYLKAYVERGDYRISFHHFLKSIAFVSRRYYSSAHSRIPNVFFPIRINDYQYSYFSRLYFLSWLASLSKERSPAGPGFVPINEAIGLLDRLGVSASGARHAVQRAIETGLVEPDVRLTSDPASWHFVRITARGQYVSHRLIGRFAYLEPMMLDTLLTSAQLRERIAGLYVEGVKPSLRQRKLCVEEFAKFLAEAEQKEQTSVHLRGLSDQCPAVMPRLDSLLEKDIAHIESLLDAKAYDL